MPNKRKAGTSPGSRFKNAIKQYVVASLLIGILVTGILFELSALL